MKLTIVAKRVGDSWEGGLISNMRFQRALVGDKLEDILLRGIIGLTGTQHAEGTHVSVEILVETSEEQEAAARADAARRKNVQA